MSTARFTSHVRSGLAVGASAGQATVELTVEADGETARPEATLQLAGPGNVVGLQPRVIARRAPTAGSADVTPGSLVFIELTEAGLPWSLSPASPSGGRLVPWLALLVLPADAVQIQSAARPLPRLLADGIAGYLPAPADLWAWAHVEGDPSDETARARLLSPLRTRPATTYVAALVPVFEDGRSAGLGDAGQRDGGFAWSAADDRLETPVYDSWRFTTGRGRSVEDLLMALTARRLQGPAPSLPIAPDGAELLDEPLPPRGGTRPLLRPAPGGDDRLAASLSDLGDGAVRSVATSLELSTDGGAEALRARIHRHLTDRGVDTKTTSINDIDLDDHARDPALIDAFSAACADDDPDGSPRLGLPAYGRIHVGGDDPAGHQNSPPWYRALNGDPGLRLSAGLATELVRRRQEELSRFAWDAAGQIDEANALLARARAGVAVNNELHARLFDPTLDDLTKLRLTSAAHRRTSRGGAGSSVADQLAGSLAASVADPDVGRAVRAGGALARVAGPGGPGLLEAADKSAEHSARPAVPPGTPVIGDDLAQHFAGPDALAEGTLATPGRLSDLLDVLLDQGAAPLEAEREPGLGEAEAEAAGRLSEDGRRPVTAPIPASGNVQGAAVDMRDVSRPRDAIRARVHARLPGIDPFTGRDPLAPVRVAPVWPEPLLEALARFAPDRVAPGVSGLAADSVAMLELDVEALEAALVGANHELAGELVWRGFPGDLRHSPIRRVMPGLIGPDRSVPPFDAPELTTWAAGIGDHLVDVPSLWLLVRTEVFRRAPGTLVYLAEAERDMDGARQLIDQGERLFPLAMGELVPGTVYLGFDLSSAAEARGDDTDAGWFVVFEQQPSEREFGLDQPIDHTVRSRGEVEALDSWNRLAWADVVGQPDNGSPQLLPAAGPLAGATLDGTNSPEWGRSSADLAAILVQRPVTVAIHASDLLDAGDD